MDVAKPYKFIGFGAMDAAKPYKFIRFGAMDAAKPYKYIWFGAMDPSRTFGRGGAIDPPGTRSAPTSYYGKGADTETAQ